MASIIEDIITGVKLHLVAKLTSVIADEVITAYPDTRIIDDPEREITKVAVGIYDFSHDLANRYSGKFYNVTRDEAALTAYLANPDTAPVPTASLTRLPLPFRMYIQVDTFCRAQYEDMALTSQMAALLASGMTFTTPDGRTYSPDIEPGADQSDLTDEGFHKVHRFSIPVWLDDPHEAQEVALVLRTVFRINIGEQIIIQG